MLENCWVSLQDILHPQCWLASKDKQIQCKFSEHQFRVVVHVYCGITKNTVSDKRKEVHVDCTCMSQWCVWCIQPKSQHCNFDSTFESPQRLVYHWICFGTYKIVTLILHYFESPQRLVYHWICFGNYIFIFIIIIQRLFWTLLFLWTTHIRASLECKLFQLH